MNTEELLTIANQAVFKLTNEYLSDLQSELLKASCKNQTYEQFAEIHGYCIDYIKKDVGCKLWHLLSEALGEKVTKKNFKQALERGKQNGNIVVPSMMKIQQNHRRDWGIAPDVSAFYGRKRELETLKQWITQDRCRVVAILGMAGIGKTFVATKLVEEIEDKFDSVIWCSLRNEPCLKSILNEIVGFLSNQQQNNAEIKNLLECMRSSRCLIILDNLESILQSGDFAGKYRNGYEQYGELLRLVEETYHQSCLILTSREKSFEIASQETTKSLVRCLKLSGSLEAAQAIISWQTLLGSDEQKQDLCRRYGYNPQILKIIATLIKDVFDGEIEEFLNQDTVAFNSIRMFFNQQFERLSEIEQIIMYSLSISGGWTSIYELLEDINTPISQTKILEALQSLVWRSLIDKRGNKYFLKPVMIDYINERLIEQIEIKSASTYMVGGTTYERLKNIVKRNTEIQSQQILAF
ncbi:MAG: NACHT domain-containing protein [Rivularia sp. (in: Bacteria)]|nr:NACHT domain-containing protein [Rivularia sp. MS3]